MMKDMTRYMANRNSQIVKLQKKKNQDIRRDVERLEKMRIKKNENKQSK